jgi:hydrogenase expression/formation protein HypC
VCIAIPARVVSISGDEAEVDLEGSRIKICTALVSDIQIGDFVLVHAGFALHVIKDLEEILF